MDSLVSSLSGFCFNKKQQPQKIPTVKTTGDPRLKKHHNHFLPASDITKTLLSPNVIKILEHLKYSIIPND